MLTFSSVNVDGISVAMAADGTTSVVEGVRPDVPIEVCEGAVGATGIVGAHLP